MPRALAVPVAAHTLNSAPVPPAEEAPAVQPAKRRQPASEPSTSPIQPGMHLSRPSVPVRNTVDEKDPYSP
jgi:hypothetical protein